MGVRGDVATFLGSSSRSSQSPGLHAPRGWGGQRKPGSLKMGEHPLSSPGVLLSALHVVGEGHVFVSFPPGRLWRRQRAGPWVWGPEFRAVFWMGLQRGLAAQAGWLQEGWRQNSDLRPSHRLRILSNSITGAHEACSRRKVKRQRLPNKGRNTRCYQNKTKQKKKEEKGKVLVQSPLAKDGEEKDEYL